VAPVEIPAPAAPATGGVVKGVVAATEATAKAAQVSQDAKLAPSPKAEPQQEPSEKSNRRGCIASVGAQLGSYKCHDDLAMSLSGNSREFELLTPEGDHPISFDALGRDGVLYEVKTGYGGIVFDRSFPEREKIIQEMVDQSVDQFTVASRCGYQLVWVFNDKRVQEFFDGVVRPTTRYVPFKCKGRQRPKKVKSK
jgi:hypothetical protein